MQIQSLFEDETFMKNIVGGLHARFNTTYYSNDVHRIPTACLFVNNKMRKNKHQAEFGLNGCPLVCMRSHWAQSVDIDEISVFILVSIRRSERMSDRKRKR